MTRRKTQAAIFCNDQSHSHMCIQNIFGNFSAVCSYIGKKGMKREKQIKKLTAYLRCRSAKVDIDVFSSRIESNALNQIKIFTAL